MISSDDDGDGSCGGSDDDIGVCGSCGGCSSDDDVGACGGRGSSDADDDVDACDGRGGCRSCVEVYEGKSCDCLELETDIIPIVFLECVCVVLICLFI